MLLLLYKLTLLPRTQFLESYKSVTIQMMASAFGVSAAFLDGELSEFIAAGRLNCKIDKARVTRTELLLRAGLTCQVVMRRLLACLRRTGRT